MSDNRAAEALASAIADRAPVDWNAALSDAAGVDAALIDRLRKIDSVASSYRSGSVADDLAPLQPGDTWGALQIIGRIGEGSFGHVYRAWDPRLDREVALKLLRDAPSAEDEVTVLEGRHLARVRHPNVVTVFGADRLNGRTGIWMELVEGETLEARLSTHGPFSPAELKVIGRDLCRALAAVHNAGLLHRDVKAQNVIRDAQGRVVLTDFGTGRNLGVGNDHERPRTAGTPLYFAPELFEGAPCSIATDIYSVGVLLYHLATGSFPIYGATLPEIRAAHLHSRSTSIDGVRPDLPRPLREVISRALAHDAAARFSTASALADALDDAVTSPARTRPYLVPWTFALIAAVALIAVVRSKPATAIPSVQRFILAVSDDGFGRFAVSPDGRRLAYIARVNNTDTLLIRPVSGELADSTLYTAGVIGHPFFSPDGRWIGFAAGPSKIGVDRLVKMPIGGGALIEVCPTNGAVGARWRADDSIVFASAGDLWSVPASGGVPSRITVTRGDGETFVDPDVLDDGTVLATQGRRGLPSRLVMVSATGNITLLEDNAGNGRYSPAGYVLFVRDHAVMARRFDGKHQATIGSAVRLADTGFVSAFEVSAGGTLVYGTRPPADQFGLGAGWANRESAAVTPLTIPIDNYRPFAWRLSRDGSKVFMALPHPRDNPVPGKLHSTVWTGDVRTGVLSQLTFEDSLPLAWSADNASVMIRRPDDSLVRKYLDHSIADQTLAEPKLAAFGNRGDWSQDETALVIHDNDQTNTSSGLLSVVFRTREATDAVRPAVSTFANSRFNEFQPVFSPDGRWVAYQSDDTGRNEIYVRPFPGPGSQVQMTTEGGSVPRWQGREIFYTRPDGGKPMIMAATVELPVAGSKDPGLQDGREPGLQPRVVETKIALRFVDFERFDVSPDGRRFLLLYGKRLRPTQLNVILNWPLLVETNKVDTTGR